MARLARRFEDAGVAALLFTDVGRDGLLKGVNVEATVALAEAVRIPVIASGGVAGIADVRAVADAGLASASEGEGPKRHIVVTGPREAAEDATSGAGAGADGGASGAAGGAPAASPATGASSPA